MNDKQTTTYRMAIIGRSGMYTYGDDAATPELARLVPGSMRPEHGDRIGVYCYHWEYSPDTCTDVIHRRVLVADLGAWPL